MQATAAWSRTLAVEVRGDDVVSHTGCVLTRMLADNTGLTRELSTALARDGVIHDRGGLLRDVAVAIADGAEAISDIRTLGDQARLLGPVASPVTTWRALGEIGKTAVKRITVARNRTRRTVWDLIADRHGGIPPIRTAVGDIDGVIGIRVDASLTTCHSNKQDAAGNFKGGFGHHSLTAWCDNTGESLAIMPRPGNAGSNTAADHIQVIDAAVAAIPFRFRRHLLVTIDGAGSSHEVLDHLTALNQRKGLTVEYSVGFDLDARVRGALALLPEAAWQPALDPEARPREDADVAELTGLLREGAGGDRLEGWPADMRILVRREKIENGTQLSLFEQHNGYRYQPLATNTKGGVPQRLEARHRVHARVEGFIRTAKATGFAKWPSQSQAINTAWLAAVALAIDLLAWTRLLLLEGPLAVAEPKTLRYRLLHTAARLIKHSRKLIIRIPETWPWATQLETAFHRVRAILT
jgi:hypothetical protein